MSERVSRDEREQERLRFSKFGWRTYQTNEIESAGSVIRQRIQQVLVTYDLQ